MRRKFTVNPANVILGEKIKQLRIQKNISPTDFRKLLNIPIHQLEKYESGVDMVPVNILEKIEEKCDLYLPKKTLRRIVTLRGMIDEKLDNTTESNKTDDKANKKIDASDELIELYQSLWTEGFNRI